MQGANRKSWTNTLILLAGLGIYSGGTLANTSDGVSCVIGTTNVWSSGFVLSDIEVTNNSGAAIDEWQVQVQLGSTNATIKNYWSASVSLEDDIVSAVNASYNGNLADGESTSFGFQGSYSGSWNEASCIVSTVPETDPETDPEETTPTDPETDPEETTPTDPDTDPEDTTPADPETDPSDISKIVIIKADDIKAQTDNWTQFFEINQERGIKVSAGIITYSLSWGNKDEYRAWLTELNDSGWVEFWNHGWDHIRWTEDGQTVYEFSGSGYELQKQHFEDAQIYMQDLFGYQPVAFGAPYNQTDTDTVAVINENGITRLMFGYKTPDGLDNTYIARMNLRGEHDGTGQPNYESFINEYNSEPDTTFTALQFHPNSFGEEDFEEYKLIVDFLIAEGWTFMLPSEYVNWLDNQ